MGQQSSAVKDNNLSKTLDGGDLEQQNKQEHHHPQHHPNAHVLPVVTRESLVERELSELQQENSFTFAGATGFEGAQQPTGHQCKGLPFSFGTCSRPGNDPQRKRTENQDCFAVVDQWGGRGNQFVACVLDGHGPNGRLVSTFCRDVWQATLLAELNATFHGSIAEAAQAGTKDMYLKHSISQACEKTAMSLQNSSIDTYVSGTTMTGIICAGNQCWSINIGDSRIVGCTKTGAMYKAVDLTVDQTPNRPDEQERIIRCGGRVFEWGVSRIWLSNVDMPGLAMSRSFGDFAGESVGVHSTPEIRAFEMNQNTPFLILASDGVWEFISSQEAVDLVAAFHANGQSPQEACAALIKESVRLWNEEEDLVDDITAVVVFNLDFGDQLPSLVRVAKVDSEGGDVGRADVVHEHVVVAATVPKGCGEEKEAEKEKEDDETKSLASDISGFSGFSE